MSVRIQLALGTVQFGLPYGVAGQAQPVDAHEVRQILRRAWKYGIRVLDTAPAYGDIEEQLALLAGDCDFSIVSKIPALPAGATAVTGAQYVRESVNRSRRRLGDRLVAVLFHQQADLLGSLAQNVWQAATDAAEKLRVGLSCYAPDVALSVAQQFPLELAQLPANVLDQRLAAVPSDALADLEVHVRSVFLQGLLLVPFERAAARVPRAASALKLFAEWCQAHETNALTAALGAVKGLTRARYCIVGVDSVAQLENVVEAWESAVPLSAPELACNDLQVIDPRRWTAQ